MASVSFSQNYGDNINPTSGYVPYNAGGYFADSNIIDNPSYTQIKGNGFNFLYYDRTPNQLRLGDDAVGKSNIFLDINSGYTTFNTPNGLRINASTSGIAGGTATHLILNVNGTNYKVQLLTP